MPRFTIYFLAIVFTVSTRLLAVDFINLPYGWKALSGVDTSAASMFGATNDDYRVKTVDLIQLFLGTHERCAATQTGTNPVSYYVSPSAFVRSWYSNAYVSLPTMITNGTGTNAVTTTNWNWTAVLYTNVFTNVIGGRSDSSMLSECQDKIRAVVPYYYDPDTVYAGTTNIAMLTVTGLWAKLGIGDRSNQFTSVPAIETKAAVYGAPSSRLYKVTLEEMYKVLEKLRLSYTPLSQSTEPNWKGGFLDGTGPYSISTTSWEESMDNAIPIFAGASPYYYFVGAEGYSWQFYVTNVIPHLYVSGIVRSFSHYYAFLSTNISLRDASLWVKGNTFLPAAYMDFYDNEDNLGTNYFSKHLGTTGTNGVCDFYVGNTNFPVAEWGTSRPTIDTPYAIGGAQGWLKVYGYVTYHPSTIQPVVDWNFRYCTTQDKE